jgi:hypothetical protein
MRDILDDDDDGDNCEGVKLLKMRFSGGLL